MKLSTPTEAAIKNKKVLVRADYDVPFEKDGAGWKVADDNRINSSLETIKFLQKNNAVTVLIAHAGRPEGKLVKKLSLQPVATRLSELLNQEIIFIPECVGEKAESMIAELEPGQIAVMENLRFHAEEQKNEKAFAKQLAKPFDVFINESFSTAHRAHASVVGLPKVLPSFAGFAFAKEVEVFTELLEKPKRPFVMIIGGAKISDKVEAVDHLSKLADAVIVGGGVANNFLKAEGFNIAKSYLQDTPADLKKKGVDYVDVAEDLINESKQERLMIDGYIPLPKIIYPTDVVAAPNLESKSGDVIELVNGEREAALKKDLMFLDIGPKTVRLFKEVILQAGTIFWNGPMGVFEHDAFDDGTKEIARAIAKSSATTILGGGDTIAAITKFGLKERYDHVSTAGGAALKFLAGKELAGITALETTTKSKK
jgi:phosphoglycerate kinase